MKTFILRNGQEIPVIGVGTGLIKHRAKSKISFLKIWIKEKIHWMLSSNYRTTNRYTISKDTKKDKMVPVILNDYLSISEFCLIDTARAYVFSEEVLAKILKNNLDKHCFLVSKVTNAAQREGKVAECIKESLYKVGVPAFDLYLLHWPQTGTYIESYKELIKARDEGTIRGVGVANFNVDHLETLKREGLEMPLVNEFECHPFLQQTELVNYCKKNGIQVIAYAPTGHKLKQFAELGKIKDICAKYGISASQVIMRWHYQNQIIPIFNTTNKSHLRNNLDIFEFELTDEEMNFINSLDRNDRYWPDPANCDFNKL